jgi:hypothetical protein
MNISASPRSSLVRAIGLLMGASFFAYLLSIAIHELGHYLSYLILGVSQRDIVYVLHPFANNYNLTLGDTSAAFGTPWRRAFGGASGPLFDLLVTVTVSLLLWRKRSPALLPLLLPGSYALLHESVNMVMGVAKGYGDWSTVVSVGVPPGILLLLSALMLAAGCIWMLLLLPLAGISAQDPLWRKLIVLLTGIPLLFLCAVVYQTLFGVDYYVPSYGGVVTMEGIRTDKMVFMVASTVLTAIITPLHRPLFPWLDRLSQTPTAQVRWRDMLVAISLGAAIVICQLVFFNDPTVVVAAG